MGSVFLGKGSVLRVVLSKLGKNSRKVYSLAYLKAADFILERELRLWNFSQADLF